MTQEQHGHAKRGMERKRERYRTRLWPQRFGLREDDPFWPALLIGGKYLGKASARMHTPSTKRSHTIFFAHYPTTMAFS
jgi:hypothetical protein